MGALSHTSILHKVFNVTTTLEACNVPGLIYPKQIYTLVLIRHMNKTKTPVNGLGLFISLKANKRTAPINECHNMLAEYCGLGYLRRGAGKGQLFYITELGLEALDTIEQKLRRSLIKIKKNDKAFTDKLPGPRKGAPMPNRWPEGKPKGRTPRAEGGK